MIYNDEIYNESTLNKGNTSSQHFKEETKKKEINQEQ